MLNDPYSSQTAARAPVLRIMSNGQPIYGALSASVHSNSYYQCDHFSLSFAMNHPANAPGWWDVNPPFLVDVQMSLDGAGWTSLIVGEVDHIRPHLQSGLIEMEGRDLSARLIEAKTQETFINQTSSDVAKTLAWRHGLTAQVTKTTTPVGRYYEQDRTNITLNQFSRTTTEWDLLTFLARQEGFDVFVQGTTLYFQPATAPNANPFAIVWTPPSPVPRLNAVSVAMERSLTLAKDIQVDVRSWNSSQERSFTKTARAIGGKASNASSSSGSKTTNTQRYVVVRPNLTQEQAQALANQLAHEWTLHERVVSVEMPGELTLTPRNMVQLIGTGTSFDQVYYIASIDRALSVDEGFRQTMRLKNSSPRTQTQV